MLMFCSPGGFSSFVGWPIEQNGCGMFFFFSFHPFNQPYPEPSPWPTLSITWSSVRYRRFWLLWSVVLGAAPFWVKIQFHVWDQILFRFFLSFFFFFDGLRWVLYYFNIIHILDLVSKPDRRPTRSLLSNSFFFFIQYIAESEWDVYYVSLFPSSPLPYLLHAVVINSVLKDQVQLVEMFHHP